MTPLNDVDDEPVTSVALVGHWDSLLAAADTAYGSRMFDVGELLGLTNLPPARLGPAIRQLAKRGYIQSYGYMVKITSTGHDLAIQVRDHVLRLKKATDEVYSAMHGGTNCFVMGRRPQDRVGIIRLAAAELDPLRPLPLRPATEMSRCLGMSEKPPVMAFTNVDHLDAVQVAQLRNAGGTSFVLEGGPRFRALELQSRFLPGWRVIDLDDHVKPAMYQLPPGY